MDEIKWDRFTIRMHERFRPNIDYHLLTKYIPRKKS